MSEQLSGVAKNSDRRDLLLLINLFKNIKDSELDKMTKTEKYFLNNLIKHYDNDLFIEYIDESGI